MLTEPVGGGGLRLETALLIAAFGGSFGSEGGGENGARDKSRGALKL